MTDPTTLRAQMLTETTSNEVCKGMTFFVSGDPTQWQIIFADYESCCVYVRERFTGEEHIMQWNSTMFVLPF